MAFDPKPHLIQLPRKVKNKATGHWETLYEEYLEVKWRLVLFREQYPHGIITTDEIVVDLDRGYARYKATVEDGQGGKATGYGTETQADFADFCERAETRALGRALAGLGYGTQFVGQDLTEGAHVVDAPVHTTTAPPSGHRSTGEPVVDDTTPVVDETTPVVSTNGDAPPTMIPAGLPRAGQAVGDLTPPQLRMLLSKVDQLAAEQGRQWQPLLEALAAEREARLEAGKRPRPLAVAADVP